MQPSATRARAHLQGGAGAARQSHPSSEVGEAIGQGGGECERVAGILASEGGMDRDGGWQAVLEVAGEGVAGVLRKTGRE